MPTEVVSIIDPDNAAGTDYTSLSSWEATEQADIVAADENHVAKCRSTSGTKDTTQCTISGWTTDATRNIRITSDSALTGSRNEDKVWDTNFYILSYTYNGGSFKWIIDIDEDYTEIEHLQLEAIWNHTEFEGFPLIRLDGTNTSIDSCLIKGEEISGDSFTLRGIMLNGNNSRATNNIVMDLIRSGTGDKRGEAIRPNATDVIVYNNTVINCFEGIRAHNGTSTIKNNIMQDCVTCFVNNNGTHTEDYNLADDATLGGTNSINNTTLTFNDKANYDFHLDSSDTDAIGAGIGPTADANVPTEDIDGDTRSGATTDIGADLFVSADVDVDGTKESIQLTEQAANVESQTEVAATQASVNITEQAASVSISVSVVAAVTNIQLTEQAAVVELPVDVAATVANVQLTEQAASVEAQTEVSAATANVQLTEQAANVESVVSVSATKATVNITELSAGIAYDLGVNAGSASVELTLLNAGVSADTGVEAGVEAVELTAQNAGVVHPINVTAAVATIELTTHAVTLDEQLSLVADVATITLQDFDASVDAPTWNPGAGLSPDWSEDAAVAGVWTEDADAAELWVEDSPP